MNFVAGFLLRSWKWLIGIAYVFNHKRTVKKLAKVEAEAEDLRILIEIMEEHESIEDRKREEKNKLASGNPDAVANFWSRVSDKDKED